MYSIYLIIDSIRLCHKKKAKLASFKINCNVTKNSSIVFNNSLIPHYLKLRAFWILQSGATPLANKSLHVFSRNCRTAKQLRSNETKLWRWECLLPSIRVNLMRSRPILKLCANITWMQLDNPNTQSSRLLLQPTRFNSKRRASVYNQIFGGLQTLSSVQTNILSDAYTSMADGAVQIVLSIVSQTKIESLLVPQHSLVYILKKLNFLVITSGSW